MSCGNIKINNKKNWADCIHLAQDIDFVLGTYEHDN
jgi:hypothetical protein